MSEYVMHAERVNPNFSMCGKSCYTSHIRTTKDLSKVTCSRCLVRLSKQHKTILDTVKTGDF